MKKRRKIGVIYKLAHYISVRTCQAFKSQTVKKLMKVFEILGCSISFKKMDFASTLW